jgi:adenosylcobinamide-GDP ribazoletransferase
VRFFRALAASFSYFSILPGKTFAHVVTDDAIAALPIVGLAIGVSAGFAGYGSFVLSHSSVIAAIVAWLVSIALSGAIHVDGFLDSCDGLFAMVPPERRLEIMRDPNHGTYAIVGMAMLTIVWILALTEIDPRSFPWILGIAGAASRSCGSAIARRPGPAAVIGYACLLAWGWYVFGYNALAGAIVMVLLTLFVARFARLRLGGVLNGDCYGAVVVSTEVALLLAVPYLKLLP